MSRLNGDEICRSYELYCAMCRAEHKDPMPPKMWLEDKYGDYSFESETIDGAKTRVVLKHPQKGQNDE